MWTGSGVRHDNSAAASFLPAMGQTRPAGAVRPADPTARGPSAAGTPDRPGHDCVPSDRVLDIGCGTGNLTLLAGEAVSAATVVGLTRIRPRSTGPAGKRCAAGSPRHSISGFAEELPYPDASFDAVLCSLALHHVSEEHGSKRCARSPGRRPGGSFHLLEMAKGDASRPVNRLVQRSPRAHLWGSWISSTMMDTRADRSGRPRPGVEVVGHVRLLYGRLRSCRPAARVGRCVSSVRRDPPGAPRQGSVSAAKKVRVRLRGGRAERIGRRALCLVRERRATPRR